MADDNIISIVSVVDEPSEEQTTQVDVSSTSRSERRQNHNTRRNARKQVVLIDVEKESIESLVSCIDLTKEVEESSSSSLSLTAASSSASAITIGIDNDIAVIHVKSTTKPPKRKTPSATRELPAQHRDHAHTVDSNSTIVIDDENNEPTTSRTKRSKSVSTTSPKNQMQAAEKKATPNLCCPVCLETIDELKSSKKQLMVTLCGHIMCNTCVDSYFKSQNSTTIQKNQTAACPTCRTKINRSKVHGLYI